MAVEHLVRPDNFFEITGQLGVLRTLRALDLEEEWLPLGGDLLHLANGMAAKDPEAGTKYMA